MKLVKNINDFRGVVSSKKKCGVVFWSEWIVSKKTHIMEQLALEIMKSIILIPRIMPSDKKNKCF